MKILLGRTFYGFGDWVMFTSLVKHINMQHPKTEVFIDTTLLPMWFLQFVCKFDIRITPICYPDPSHYDVYIKHVSYSPVRTMNEHLLESMVKTFNRQVGRTTDLHLIYDATCLAKCIGQCITKVPYISNPAVIIAPENGSSMSSRCKDWEYHNFLELAELLRRAGINVVQIGSSSTGLAPSVLGTDTVYRDLSLPVMLELMQRSKAVITTESGVSHFAGHHSIRTFTIYRPIAPTKPDNTWYPGQTAIVGEIIDPGQLAQTILNAVNEMEII